MGNLFRSFFGNLQKKKSKKKRVFPHKMLKSSLIGSIISTIYFICEAKQSAPYIAVLKKSVHTTTLSVWYVYLHLP